jgi:hypothetical protein
MSFMEVMVAVLIAGIIATPIYILFSTSRRMGASAKHLVEAMGIGSSYISSLKEVQANLVPEVTSAEDTSLNGVLELESLGIPPCPEGFTRTLTTQKVISELGKVYLEVSLIVGWKDPVTGKPKNYPLFTLLPGG